MVGGAEARWRASDANRHMGRVVRSCEQDDTRYFGVTNMARMVGSWLAFRQGNSSMVEAENTQSRRGIARPASTFSNVPGDDSPTD
jgi:hypothetical protein